MSVPKVLVFLFAVLALLASLYYDFLYVRPREVADQKEQKASEPTSENEDKPAEGTPEVPAGPVNAKKKAIDTYKAALKKQKSREQQRIIENHNREVAYKGDGSRASRRLYLAQQAYKRSRAATPIIPLDMIMAEEEETEEDVLQTLELLDKEEKVAAEQAPEQAPEPEQETPQQTPQETTPPEAPVLPAVPAPRKISIPKEIWEMRDDLRPGEKFE